jgi:hypothetical protein
VPDEACRLQPGARPSAFLRAVERRVGGRDQPVERVRQPGGCTPTDTVAGGSGLLEDVLQPRRASAMTCVF